MRVSCRGWGMSMPDAGRWVQLRAAEGRFLPPPEVTGAGGEGCDSEGRFRGSGSCRCRNLDDHNGPGNEGTDRGTILKVRFQ